jgi:serine/threonine-protein kinase RsbW/non-specific serine/threonine protein kinase
VDELVAVFMARAWVDEEGATWLRLCLDEALVNAMYHGNQGDPNLMVTVRVGRIDDHWCLEVVDQGAGFTEADVPSGDDPEALLREHGRGLLLMLEWLDSLRYYQGGRIVHMRRHIGS